MYSDEKYKGNGTFDIVLSILYYATLMGTPFVSLVVNGEVVQNNTVIGMIEEKGNNLFCTVIELSLFLTLAIGVLRFTLPKLFHQFVLSVIDLYNSLFLFGLGIAFWIVASDFVDGSSGYMGFNSYRYMMGLCPIGLSFLGFMLVFYTILNFSNFYKWYPLQSLYWGVYSLLFRSFVVSLVYWAIRAVIPAIGLNDDLNLAIQIILSLGVLIAEIWVLYTYGKEWNRKLRERANRKKQQEAVLTVTVTDESSEVVQEVPSPLPDTPVIEEKTEPAAVPANEVKPEPAAVPTFKVKSEPAAPLKPESAAPAKRKFTFYYLIGGAVAVLALIFFFLGKGEEAVPVNIPAVKEISMNGWIAGKNVKMNLTQIGDTVYGSYFYTHINNPIKLAGKLVDINYIIDESVNGKKTGTFRLYESEYDGFSFLTGKWSNGKKEFNVQLDYTGYRILPSSDPEYPFVGEWMCQEPDGTFLKCTFNLYNRDIDDFYGKMTLWDNASLSKYEVDSILSLKGNKAVVLANAYGKLQEMTLTYNASDRSISMEAGSIGNHTLALNLDGGCYRLFATESEEEVLEPAPVAEKVEELVIVEDDDNASSSSESTSEESAEVKSAPVSTEEEDTEAELDRIKAELEENMKKYMEEAPDKIYDKVQVMPEYPGGTIEMMRFISRNLEYPKSAQESGTQGKVVIQFVVGTDGSVSNVQVIRSVDPLLDKEAVRIISAMPHWKPGTEGGKPVRVKYTVPINFRLQ